MTLEMAAESAAATLHTNGSIDTRRKFPVSETPFQLVASLLAPVSPIQDGHVLFRHGPDKHPNAPSPLKRLVNPKRLIVIPPRKQAEPGADDVIVVPPVDATRPREVERVRDVALFHSRLHARPVSRRNQVARESAQPRGLGTALSPRGLNLRVPHFILFVYVFICFIVSLLKLSLRAFFICLVSFVHV